MVDWTDIPDRNRGRIRPRYSANVAPINPGWDDRRSAHLRKSFADNVNATREHRATWENPNWLLAQGPEKWKEQSFRDKARPVVSQLKGNQDFWTTDPDESRNMYQMVMNNMYGGKGARMLDMRGLPSIIQGDPNRYRRGRTLFQDPSKSQGLFGDLASMVLRRPNPAAVRAPEWNPLYDDGYARDWYIDKFGKPWGEKLSGIMKLAAPGPLKFIKGKEREPLTPDRSWIPENVGAYNEIDEIPFMGEFEEKVDLLPGTDLYGPYKEDWEKLQSFLRGDIERDADIDRIYFDTQRPIIEETDEMDEFMSGNIGILNPLQPDDIFEESETIDITDGAEEEIISETVEKNPWIMRILGNDVKGLRGYLWDIGILNPNSDMYQKTDQLKQPNSQTSYDYWNKMVD